MSSFARECDDHGFARAGTAIGSAGLVPSRQRAVPLKSQKAPSEWDHPAAKAASEPDTQHASVAIGARR
jgi:hypothetical protein